MQSLVSANHAHAAENLVQQRALPGDLRVCSQVLPARSALEHVLLGPEAKAGALLPALLSARVAADEHDFSGVPPFHGERQAVAERSGPQGAVLVPAPCCCELVRGATRQRQLRQPGPARRAHAWKREAGQQLEAVGDVARLHRPINATVGGVFSRRRRHGRSVAGARRECAAHKTRDPGRGPGSRGTSEIYPDLSALRAWA